MSYMRGDIYIHQSADDDVHIWSTTGNDGWRESVWGEGCDESASGVAISGEIFDELVAMRLAELLGEKKLRAAVERALQKWEGNGGCAELVRLKDKIAQFED